MDQRLALPGVLADKFIFNRLTKREHQVLMAALDGLDSAQTSQRLGISLRTVETHRTHIVAKCGVSNMCDLFRILALYGLGH